MFTFIERKRFHQIAVDEAPQLFLALVIAETAYKFHSFTAETVVFLGTWWLLSALRHYRR